MAWHSYWPHLHVQRSHWPCSGSDQCCPWQIQWSQEPPPWTLSWQWWTPSHLDQPYLLVWPRLQYPSSEYKQTLEQVSQCQGGLSCLQWSPAFNHKDVSIRDKTQRITFSSAWPQDQLHGSVPTYQELLFPSDQFYLQCRIWEVSLQFTISLPWIFKGLFSQSIKYSPSWLALFT